MLNLFLLLLLHDEGLKLLPGVRSVGGGDGEEPLSVELHWLGLRVSLAREPPANRFFLAQVTYKHLEELGDRSI